MTADNKSALPLKNKFARAGRRAQMAAQVKTLRRVPRAFNACSRHACEYFEDEPRRGEAHPRRGPAHRGEHRKAAGTAAAEGGALRPGEVAAI
jgi:hypothetical protein